MALRLSATSVRAMRAKLASEDSMTANGLPAVACAMPLATVALVRACGAFIAVLRNHAEIVLTMSPTCFRNR